jgi:hypothetical protein
MAGRTARIHEAQDRYRRTGSSVGDLLICGQYGSRLDADARASLRNIPNVGHYVRSDLKPARISSDRSFGCSQAAK